MVNNFQTTSSNTIFEREVGISFDLSLFIGSANGLALNRYQAINQTNVDQLC